jgi:general secretion pathway protein D
MTTVTRLLLLAAALAGTPAARAADAAITLNFKDADVREVAASIGEITGRNFILDPRVKGKVTVVSSRPIALDSVYPVFLSVLQVNGFAAVPSGTMVKIVPTVDARVTPGRAAATGAPADEVVTHVIELQNVSATQMMGALRPLVAQYGHIAPAAGANALIIADTAANIARLTAILERVDQVNDGSIEVVPLTHASAGDVVRVLTALLQGQPKDGGAGPTVVADERTNSVLIGGTRNERLRLGTLVAHLDTPRSDEGNTQVVYLRYADAENLAKILQGYTAAPRTTGAGATPAAGGGGSGSLLEGVSIVPEPDTNALVIDAPPRQMQAVRSIIDKLDIRRAQVHVEAIIVEMSADRAAELGVTWAVDSTSNGVAGFTNFPRVGPGLIQVGAAGAAGTSAVSLVPDGMTMGVGRIVDGGVSFAALARALAGDARTNILSTPSLVTMDNEEAEIKVGQEVPFITGQYTGTGGSTTPTNPFQTVERKEVGVKLKIKPKINEGDAVFLDIEQEVSSLASSAVSTVDAVTNKRTITTHVLANDGEIIVLGGLIDDNLQESEQRVPVLGAIPGIGALFRYRKTTKVKQNLIVFLRPRILHTAQDAANFTESKYLQLRELQRQRDERSVPLMPDAARPALPPLETPAEAAPTAPGDEQP